jgi:hypothetical protein
MSKPCSCLEPHAAHTYNGRPMLLCPGVGRQDLHGTENVWKGSIQRTLDDWEESDTRKAIDVIAREGRVSPESTFCIDCGQPTTPGKGSARCPSCWQDRCGQIQDDAQHNAWERSEKE